MNNFCIHMIKNYFFQIKKILWRIRVNISFRNISFVEMNFSKLINYRWICVEMANVLQYYIQSCAHLCVNPIMKFIYTLCKHNCIIFIYIRVSVKPCKFILCSVKRCKCKKIYIYIVLWGPIKQCIWQIFTLASCKCKRFGLVSVNHLH